MKSTYYIKKVLLVLFSVMLCSLLLPTTLFCKNEDTAPTRTINVVYDDSGSMYEPKDNVLVDNWCQAKYSMEVFASMLGEKDKMNIYYMSDYSNGTSKSPRIKIDGSNKKSDNVRKIHTEKTESSWTPFTSVEKAYRDLTKSKSDEKWLVVLTDGEFIGKNNKTTKSKKDVDKYFSSKKKDVNVMFLSIGKDASTITADESNNIYCEKAANSSDILKKILNISNKIFNSNALNISNENTKKFSFDVPMKELVVFAQGSNVSINGILTKDKKSLIKSTEDPVEVKYSEKSDAKNHKKNKPTTKLLGKIANFKCDFKAGDYVLDVDGAETIEIYYKPNVDVDFYLYDKNDNIIRDVKDIHSGTYKLMIQLVNHSTKKPIPSSNLLGNIEYSANITQNGIKDNKTYKNGDKLALKEGDIALSINAKYLKYNSTSSTFNYHVYKNKQVTFNVDDNPKFLINKDGFEKNETIKINSLIDGKEFTKEQWKLMTPPKIKLHNEDCDFEIELNDLKKSDQIGVFYLKPNFPNQKPSTGTYENLEYEIICKQKNGSETWSGSKKNTIQFIDNRGFYDKHPGIVWSCIGLLILILYILSITVFKKRLPKALSKSPKIIVKVDDGLGSSMMSDGNVRVKAYTIFVPFIPQKAVITYIPKAQFVGCADVEVKANVNRINMLIENWKEFENNKNIMFDSSCIQKNEKNRTISAASVIRVKKESAGITYSSECYLNRK